MGVKQLDTVQFLTRIPLLMLWRPSVIDATIVIAGIKLHV